MAVPVAPVISGGESPADTAEITDQTPGVNHRTYVSPTLGSVKQIDGSQIRLSKDQLTIRLGYDGVRYCFKHRCFCPGGALR